MMAANHLGDDATGPDFNVGPIKPVLSFSYDEQDHHPYGVGRFYIESRHLDHFNAQGTEGGVRPSFSENENENAEHG